MARDVRISTLPRFRGRHAGAALLVAKRQYPDAVWGEWHQGPNGRTRIVGRIPGREAFDPVVVEVYRD